MKEKIVPAHNVNKYIANITSDSKQTMIWYKAHKCLLGGLVSCGILLYITPEENICSLSHINKYVCICLEKAMKAHLLIFYFQKSSLMAL